MKTQARIEAQRLRADGWSVKEIECALGIARSTVSLWTREVPLSDAARQRLIQRARQGVLLSAEKRSAQAHAIREGYQQRGREWAHERGPDYAAGCALFWAEGSRRRNTVVFTNSDPQMLGFFAGFLRRHFASPTMTLTCNLFADHADRQRDIEDFWLAELGLSRESLRKSTVNRYSKYSQKKRQNRLPYGTARLTVHSTEIVQTIYGSIQELAGFDRPAWLD